MTPNGISNVSSGLQALDRKAMEAERLARLSKKRQAPDQEEQVVRPPPSKIHRTTSLTEGAASKDLVAVASFTTRIKDADDRTDLNESSKMQSPLQFPHGAVRKTWAFGHNRTARDIKIEEVLQKGTLRSAVLSSFQWDMNWIFGKLDMSKTKVCLIMQAKDDQTKSQYRQESASWSKLLRLHFPPMPGQVWCMHSKLMLLFHANYLRIVIPTANLVPYDWGETGIMENTVFLIDLPRLPANHVRDNHDTMTAFGNGLIEFIDTMGPEDDVKSGIRSFDFTETAPFAFIHNVGGSHSGDNILQTGMLGLSKAVKSLNLQLADDEPLELDYAASSLGSLNNGFLNQLASAARGVNPEVSENTKSKTAPSRHNSPSFKDFRICFPTHQTVARSTGGTQNGGTICLQRKWYEGDKFPLERMRNYESSRPGLLSHNKMMLARSSKVAWAYIGSANLSESAWGKLTKDRSSRQLKISCRNWECGVLIPVKTRLETGGVASDGAPSTETSRKETGKQVEEEHPTVLGMDVFDKTLDLPMKYPGQKYGNQQPWYFMENG